MANRIVTKDLLRIADLAPHELQDLLDTAAEFKRLPSLAAEVLRGRSVCLLFEKPSLRTRMSFEVGVFRMGGQAVYLDHQHTPLGARESIADYGRNLERWCHAIVARVRRHATLQALAEATQVPVINALCDLHHPCQALADFQTLLEHGFDPQHSTLAWVGDGNNVCHSLMETATALGCGMTVITPPGYAPSEEIHAACVARAMRTGARLHLTHDLSAVAGAFAVYTDTWISMGQEEDTHKLCALTKYQVTSTLLDEAGSEALFMHCLPAHRGQEVTNEVMDGPRSVIFDQAENRMHAQNALLDRLLGAPLLQARS